MKRTTRVLLGSVVLGLSFLSASVNIEKPKMMARVVPVPSALLLNAYKYMGGLKNISIEAVTTSDDIYQNKMVVTYTHHIRIEMKRPDRLYISVHGDLKDKAYYINHGHFTVFDHRLGYYGTLKVPVTIDAALDALFEKYDIKTSLANILYRDLDKRIPPKNKGYYLGISDVDNIPCHHIGFISETQEYQVWIEEGKKPLIRKFLIIDKTEPYLPRSGTVLKWKTDDKREMNLFRFTAPETAKQIDITPADEWEEAL
jgi:hypothetical protein